MKSNSYQTIPTVENGFDSLNIDHPSLRNRTSTKKYKLHIAASIIGVFVLCGFIIEIASDSEFANKYKRFIDVLSGKRSEANISSSVGDFIPPTLQAGGGRDWELNIDDGTIVAKHDENLVLGALKYTPLVLTNQGDPNQVTFPINQLDELSKGSPVQLSGLTLQYPDDPLKEFDVYYYKEIGVSQKSSPTLTLQYLDSNFIVWNDGNGRDMVLDISFNVQLKGNTVNFVSVNEDTSPWWKKWLQPKTFEYGGGRDWILNTNDGTISPKHAPYLVLGYGPIHLMLAERGSSEARSFENLEALARNETVKLIFSDGNEGIGKLEKKEQYAGPWRYIEGVVVSKNDTVPLKYIENNYIATAEENVPEEKALVLDVSFWKMFSGNTVNFVGGWVWKQPNDNDDNDDDGNNTGMF
mmetsp:Transcript_5185/g.7660  ORF Transcript_5185/g.7660 Transcript_5185/m.7660 type:complete len:411 (+) Transcript_5185:57-1289(+)